MDYAQQHGLIRVGTRIDLLTSRLVLIAPRDSVVPPAPINPTTPLTAMLGDGRLAVCDPAAMPAGRYARAALRSLGLWPQVQDRIAIAETVRSAVLDVARQEAPLGIVFDTDAALDPGVKVIGTFPADSYPPIVYPVALTRTAKPAAADFLRLLAGPRAAAVFQSAGYGVLGR